MLFCSVPIGGAISLLISTSSAFFCCFRKYIIKLLKRLLAAVLQADCAIIRSANQQEEHRRERQEKNREERRREEETETIAQLTLGQAPPPGQPSGLCRVGGNRCAAEIVGLQRLSLSMESHRKAAQKTMRHSQRS